MPIPFFSSSTDLPFDGIEEHANKVKECGWIFQQAIECYVSGNYSRFQKYQGEIDLLESKADEMKREIRSIIPKGKKMAVEAFLLFAYIREQDKVLDSVEECLSWISYKPQFTTTDGIKKGLVDLVNAVIAPIDELGIMVAEAKKYFKNYSTQQYKIVKETINNLRRYEHEADILEEALKLNLFTHEKDPISVYHMIKLTELIGSVADHAENAGDMMRAMITE